MATNLMIYEVSRPMERPVMKLLTNFYGQKWRAALSGQANPANWPISGKIAKMELFNQCMEFKNYLGQMTSFEVFKNSP